VNVYRLLRTGLRVDKHETLVGDHGESNLYWAILTQLAIVTGAPSLADSYFRALEAARRVETATLLDIAEIINANREPAEAVEWRNLDGAFQLLVERAPSHDMLVALSTHANTVRRYSFAARPYL